MKSLDIFQWRSLAMPLLPIRRAFGCGVGRGQLTRTMASNSADRYQAGKWAFRLRYRVRAHDPRISAVMAQVWRALSLLL